MVWKMLRVHIIFHELAFGTNTFFCEMLPKITASTPASENLIPANKICDIESAASTPKIRYPILMLGNALPHSKQQTIAKAQTTYLLLSDTLFFLIDSN